MHMMPSGGLRNIGWTLDEGSSDPGAASSPGVAPSTALSYPPSHYSVGDGSLLGTSADRNGDSKGCEKGADPLRSLPAVARRDRRRDRPGGARTFRPGLCRGRSRRPRGQRPSEILPSGAAAPPRSPNRARRATGRARAPGATLPPRSSGSPRRRRSPGEPPPRWTAWTKKLLPLDFKYTLSTTLADRKSQAPSTERGGSEHGNRSKTFSDTDRLPVDRGGAAQAPGGTLARAVFRPRG